MNKAHYFYRTAAFTRRNGEVALADIDNPQQTTPLDPWLATVVSLADGLHSIEQLIDYMAASYGGQVPAKLEETIVSAIERLMDGKLVATSEQPVELPYYLIEPVEKLDLERARAMMADDGYQPE